MGSKFRPAGISSDEDSDEGFSFSESTCTKSGIKELSLAKVEIPLNDIDILRMAAIEGNVESLQSIMEKKILKVDVITKGWTPLMFAASNCHYDAVKFLLEMGANPNFHQHCYSILMSVCACTKQTQDVRLKCIQLLLESGANVNMRQRNGVTPLMMACKEGSDKIVEELINANADINAQDVMGWTPLIWSIHHNKQEQLEIIKLLLDAGADVTIKCGKGHTAQTHALNLGYNHIATLVPGVQLNKEASAKLESATIATDSWKYIRENLEGIDEGKWVLWHDVARSLNQLGLLRRYGPIFKEKNIDLVKFLICTEEELENLSIIPVHRKRLLDLIRKFHLTRWKERSIGLKNIKNMQDGYDITDEIKLVANIARQITIIHATIAYIRMHIKSKCEIGSDLKIKDVGLHSEIRSTLNRAKALHKDLESYFYCIKAKSGEKRYPPDWIGYEKPRKKSYCPLTLMLVTVGVIGIIMWRTNKYPGVYTFIKC